MTQDDLDINEALYAGAHSTMRTAEYSQRGPVVPTDNQLAKFKTQVIRFLEACPEECTVIELLEQLT